MANFRLFLTVMFASIIFALSCHVPQYSKKYFKVAEVVDDSTYIAKIQVGDWVQTYTVVQEYEKWKVGDTIYFTNKFPEEN